MYVICYMCVLAQACVCRDQRSTSSSFSVTLHCLGHVTLLNCTLSLTGDQLPKTLEGFFIYEEEGSGVPGSDRRGNDAIVVEQWTVIEVSRSPHQSAFLLRVVL